MTDDRHSTVRPLSAAAFLGAGALLYGLAFPPYDLGQVAWIALVPLLLAVRGRSAGGAFLFGLVYGAACAAIVGVWFIPTIAGSWTCHSPSPSSSARCTCS